jgi:hypothetical protein
MACLVLTSTHSHTPCPCDLRRSWAFTDVVGLDDDSLKMVPSPCVGLIFLYPFSQCEMRKKSLGRDRGHPVEGVWYMSQVIGNACGAVALMHTVMNTMDTVSSDSKFLSRFRSDAKSADADSRGKLFGSAFRDLHSEVSGNGQTEAPKPNADLDFHFVSLVEVSCAVLPLSPLCLPSSPRRPSPVAPCGQCTHCHVHVHVHVATRELRSTGSCMSSTATTTARLTWGRSARVRMPFSKAQLRTVRRRTSLPSRTRTLA